jgi:tetratricopeptide (TPR) repeat protein
MSKHKNADKLTNDFHRLLAAQNFSSEQDVKDFMEKMIGQAIPEFPDEILSGPERAEDLIFKASEQQNFDKALVLIHEALNLDPDCIPAWDLLGQTEPHPLIALTFFEKGIAIGRKKFDEKFIKKHAGHFWQIHETRPFMKVLSYRGQTLHALGKIQECIAAFEEILHLNPMDNMSVREQLSICLIQVGAYQKYEKLQKEFEDDGSLSANLTHALYLFITKGQTPKADAQLKAALKLNKHVAKLLLSRVKPDFMNDSILMGGTSEAEYYADLAYDLWHAHPAALVWLKKVG